MFAHRPCLLLRPRHTFGRPAGPRLWSRLLLRVGGRRPFLGCRCPPVPAVAPRRLRAAACPFSSRLFAFAVLSNTLADRSLPQFAISLRKRLRLSLNVEPTLDINTPPVSLLLLLILSRSLIPQQRWPITMSGDFCAINNARRQRRLLRENGHNFPMNERLPQFNSHARLSPLSHFSPSRLYH